jgi:hypothetical protein
LKSYPLESVEYQGRQYSECSASIDEESHQAEFLHSKGLGSKKLVSIGSLSFDDRTEVRLEGKTIKAGPWAIVASSETDAAGIMKLLLKPKETRAKLAGEIFEVEKSVSSFLKLREEGINFLIKLLGDPRGVSFGLSSSWSSPNMGPVEEFLTNQAMNLSSALRDINSAVAPLVGKVSEEKVDRIYAFVYATAMLQNSLLAGGESRGDAEGMLAELGIRLPSSSWVDTQAAYASLMQIAHPILFSGEPPSVPKN